MSHEHIFELDLDGQVTCSICGAMDDEMPQNKSNWQNNPNFWETQVSFEE